MMLSEEDTQEEVRMLIKSCFMDVPEIDFTQN